MSRQRTIWEKISTLWPPAFILGSNLSIRTNLPADWIIACRWKSEADGLYVSRNSPSIFSSAPIKERWNNTSNEKFQVISSWFKWELVLFYTSVIYNILVATILFLIELFKFVSNLPQYNNVNFTEDTENIFGIFWSLYVDFCLLNSKWACLGKTD